MTAGEALKYKVFDTIRDPVKEKILDRMRKKRIESQSYKRHLNGEMTNIQLDIDASDAFDYENSENTKYSVF